MWGRGCRGKGIRKAERENGSGGVRLEGREGSVRRKGTGTEKVGALRESCNCRRREEEASLLFSDEARANRIRRRVR